MQATDVQIEESWKNALSEEFGKDYFTKLKEFLKEEKSRGNIIYPPGKQIFSAFDLTPFDEVKVVLLGQDPYHGPGQAHGLSFSIMDGIAQPPSLKNIFKELYTDLGISPPPHGNLTHWAEQGVFLLNAILTVKANSAASHQKKGWEEFTDAVIKTISDQKSGIIFLLWGKFAQGKEVLIDTTKHYVLKAAHPSPLAGGAFFGSKPFSQTNELLRKQGKAVIDWRL